MWDTKTTEWNAVNMGPKRDIVGELAKAIKARDMKFVTTFHHSHNWWFFPKPTDMAADTNDPKYSMLYSRRTAANELPDKEYLDTWRTKLVEVIDNYEPDLIWFDFGLGSIREKYRKEFLAYYYNKAEEWGREVVVTYKQMHGSYNLPPLTAVLDFEVGKMNELTPYPWLSDTSVDAVPRGCWSHTTHAGYKSTERLVHNLVDRVSKNGYLLLNVGPRADGSIPAAARECLEGIGDWLKINGEAIFGTVPWVTSGGGPTKSEGGDHFNETNESRFTAHDYRFTVKKDVLYMICLGRPGDRVTIPAFKDCKQLYKEDIAGISMLGVDGGLSWSLDEEGLSIDVPERVPSSIAVTFKIQTKAGV